jgi:hypothetical protein
LLSFVGGSVSGHSRTTRSAMPPSQASIRAACTERSCNGADEECLSFSHAPLRLPRAHFRSDLPVWLVAAPSSACASAQSLIMPIAQRSPRCTYRPTRFVNSFSIAVIGCVLCR